MHSGLRRSTTIILLCAAVITIELTSADPVRAEQIERTYETRDEHGYNPEYIFAATYGLTEMRVPAPLKIPLVPVTLVMDVALLPFEIVAGCF
jgi:uncharacterized protein YceK